MWIGITPGGRVLSIIFTTEDSQILRLITAYEAKREVADEYYARSGEPVTPSSRNRR